MINRTRSTGGKGQRPSQKAKMPMALFTLGRHGYPPTSLWHRTRVSLLCLTSPNKAKVSVNPVAVETTFDTLGARSPPPGCSRQIVRRRPWPRWPACSGCDGTCMFVPGHTALWDSRIVFFSFTDCNLIHGRCEDQPLHYLYHTLQQRLQTPC